MICNYFQVIDITIVKMIIWNIQLAQDVPGTSNKSPLKVLTFGTYKNPGDSQGTNTKIDDFMKKIVFQK